MWGSYIFSKYLKLNRDFKNVGKNSEKIFCFRDNCIWIGIVNLSLLRRGHFSSRANLLTTSPKIWDVNKRDFFPTQFDWQWSIKMIKVLWCRFQQCLRKFTMLLVEGSPETGLFRHLSYHVFRVSNFANKKSMSAIFCFKIFKIWSRFQKFKKNWEKVFGFWDNCIWIGIVQLSLIRTGFFSSAANVLTSSPKISHVNKGDFFQLSWLGSDRSI